MEVQYGDYVTVSLSDVDLAPAFLRMGRDYLAEVLPERCAEEHEAFLRSILDQQGEPDRWLILFKHEGEFIGFTHARIDCDERVGWGYILEFYVVPSVRRSGMGRLLYRHVLGMFRSRGAEQIWLSSHPKAGHFWQSVGFQETGESEGGQKVMVANAAVTKEDCIRPRKIEGWQFFDENTEACDSGDMVSFDELDERDRQVPGFFVNALSCRRRVIDIGCGGGYPGLYVAPHVGEFIGVDASPNMITHASASIQRLGASNASCIIGDGGSLQSADGEFDGIMLCGVLMSMDWESARRVMAEARRVAAPGACVAALDQDWIDTLARRPADQASIRNEKGRLFLQSVVRLENPHMEVDARYYVDTESPSGQRLMGELGEKTRVQTSLRAEDLAPCDVLDATYEEAAQFDCDTYAELFRMYGFLDIKCESVYVPAWGDRILFLTAEG